MSMGNPSKLDSLKTRHCHSPERYRKIDPGKGMTYVNGCMTP